MGAKIATTHNYACGTPLNTLQMASVIKHMPIYALLVLVWGVLFYLCLRSQVPKWVTDSE